MYPCKYTWGAISPSVVSKVEQHNNQSPIKSQRVAGEWSGERLQSSLKLLGWVTGQRISGVTSMHAPIIYWTLAEKTVFT